MKHNFKNPRPLAAGMGQAVARRTILRKKNLDSTIRSKADEMAQVPFRWETWDEVAARVALGNTMIHTTGAKDFARLRDHIANGSALTSGRHLQHGDETQPKRCLEVFSNCSSSSTSFWKFYLLLNGSGVGRCYDDDLMVVDWSKQPFIHVVLDETHPDYDFTCMESLKQVQHKYGKYNIITFEVEDSREGWAKALEYLESMIFDKGHDNDVVVFDFSKVRPRGSLIGGMQMRPSSGPVPTMNMFNNIKSLKGCHMPKWRQAMYVDHYAAESVLVGGARRSARICVKHWRDKGIIDYINIKKNWTIPSVRSTDGSVTRKARKVVPLWSANNSVGVDDEFWREHKIKGTWANEVFEAICNASYHHGTGEPGIVNMHKLESRHEGMFEKVTELMRSNAYTMNHGHKLCKTLLSIIQTKRHVMIPNPCIPNYTQFTTPNGLKELKDLKIGDEVWSGLCWTPLTDIWCTGEKEVWRHYFSNGRCLDCTADHRVVSNGEKRLICEVNTVDEGKFYPGITSCEDRVFNDKQQSLAIVKRESIGIMPVYDFTVDAHEHTAMINGVLVSNCGEISLFMQGSYCTIFDLALYYCETIEECEEVARLATRFLIRVNMLPNVYAEETARTNRIGVGLTGIQEFAWKFFKLTFKDLLDEIKAKPFWDTVDKISNSVRDESIIYAKKTKTKVPHTCTTIKPSGSVSKLFGLTEGAHLPAMARYLRWVQFRKDDPLVQKYKDSGHKTKDLKQYEGTTVVAFPTEIELCKCGATPVVMANEATMDEQYRWLHLLEKHWLCGGDESARWGNQVSYTLKYSKKNISYEAFKDAISQRQPYIRSCSVMPTISTMDDAEYEYLPEEPMTLEAYNECVAAIKDKVDEDIDEIHVGCASGACPVSFEKD